MAEPDTAAAKMASAKVEAPNAIQPDANSTAEGKNLFGDAGRHEELKAAAHRMFLTSLKVAAVMFIAVLVVRILHYILPTGWSWLTDAQLQGIDKFFFSGALGALLTKYAKQVVPQ